MLSKLRKPDICPIFESQRQATFQSPESLVTERKFDTAIRRSQVEGFQKRLHEGRSTLDDQILLEGIRQLGHDATTLRIDDAVYARYLQKVLTSNVIVRRLSPKDHHHVNRIWEAIKLNIQCQVQYMCSNSYLKTTQSLTKELQEFLDAKAPDNLLCLLMTHCVRLSSMIERIGLIQGIRQSGKSTEAYIKECNTVNKWKDEGIGLSLVWSNRLCIIQLSGDRCYLMPRPYLLMIHNKLCDLMSVLVCGKSMEGVSVNDDFYDKIVLLVKELCRLNIKMQSNYFTLVKSLESLVVAEALRKVDSWDNKEFYDSLTDELYNSIGYCYEGSTLQDIIQSVDIPSQHELGCLSKIVGHPLINMKSGARTLHAKTTEQYTLDKITLSKCECHIKINYIRNHIVREKRWPPCYLSSGNIHPAIKEAWAKNIDPYHNALKDKYGVPNVLDFQAVELLPNIKYSKLENTIPYLKDKTISLFRNKVLVNYLEKAVKQSDDSETYRVDWKDTRLLLYYLMNPTSALNHDKYIDMYAASGDLEELLDYLVIRCVPKEKELKIDPRFFGCKTYEERFRSLSQEKNAMKFLELYCDEQAMTLSELELARRLIAFRRLRMAYKDHTILYIVVDASSWNNHFRRETVDDLMVNTLDKIYNTSIFGKTHLAFQKTLIHVPDEEEVYMWDGQSGGIEGLNQDTWVITYLAQVKTALEPLNLKYHALCKGDDLRIAICIPNHVLNTEDIPKFKNEVMDKVSKTARDLGHKIKIEESYGSLKYFAFSKEASIGDIMLPQTLRKIQKVHGYNNAFLPYLDDMCGSTYSNAHAACKVSPTILPPEITGLFWLYFYLTQHPQYQNLTIDELVGLTLVPSLCGGLPIIYHHNMYVRAESDLLAPFIGLLKYCKYKFPQLYSVMINFCQTPNDPPTTLERVYKDPYSITTSMPTLPSSLLRIKMEKLLPKITKNQDVQALIKAANSTSASDFVRALDSSNILPARVFASLYAASPKGVLSEFLTKFETARSVLQVLILGSGKRRAHRTLRSLVKQEAKLQMWRYNVLKGRYQGQSYVDLIDNYECPAQIANLIRERSWGKRIETVTMPPLQHQVIIKDPNVDNLTKHDIQGHFTFQTTKSKKTIVHDSRPHYSSGDNRPFEGYTTRTGTIEPTMSFIDKDVLLAKLQNIIELASWTNKVGRCPITDKHLESNLYKLIETLVVQYTDEPMKTFAPFVGCRRSGTVQHHIRCPGYRESIVPNTLLNLYTHVVGESDSNLLINQFPGHHYKINFLHVFCYTVNIIYLHNEIYKTPSSDAVIWSITAPCEYCLQPIKETPITIDEQTLQQIDFSSLRSTKVSEDAMDVLYKSLELFKDRVYLVPNEDTLLTNAIACEGVMQELMETIITSKDTLITRYTQHVTAGEGKTILGSFAVKAKRREIGLSELKRLSPADLTNSLLSTIYYMIMTKFQWDGSRPLHVAMTIIPASELPWYDLVAYLFNHGKISDVFKTLSKRTGIIVTSAFNTAENCAIVLGSQAVQQADYYLRDISLVVLSNYETPKINRNVARQLFTLARYISNTRLPQVIPRKDKKLEYTHDEKLSLLVLFYFWTIPFWDSEAIILEQRNIGTTEVHLMDIVDYELEDISELWDANNPDVLMERNTNLLTYLLRKYKITWDDLFEVHNQYYEPAYQVLSNTVNLIEITVSLTTLSDCIGKIREIVDISDTGSEDFVPAPSTSTTNIECTTPRRSRSIVPVGSYTEEAWITEQTMITTPVFQMFREPIRHVEYLSRPFGIANCSMSTIYYIMDLLKAIPVHNMLRANIMCLADGIGNIASGLSKIYPWSHIVYSSLHTVLGMNYKPTELIMSCEENNCQLDYTSIKIGMTDLYQSSTRNYFIDLDITTHIFTCDIELRSWSPSIQPTYLNVLKIYHAKRCHPGLIILKINHSYAEETVWVIHVLSTLCSNLLLVHPPTIRCHKVSYLVGYGIATENVNWNIISQFPMVRVSPNIIGTYTKFRNHCLDLHKDKIKETMTTTPKVPPALTLNIRLLNSSPMLFASMLIHLAGIFIDIDSFFSELTESDVENFYPVYAQYILKKAKLHIYIDDYKDHLVTGDVMNVKNRSYDLNIRAHRVYITQKLMFLLGLTFYLQWVEKTGRLVPPYIDIKTNYLSHYDRLNHRDKYVTEPTSHFSISINDQGLDLSYYSHYMKGINTSMTSIAYARTSTVTSIKTRAEMNKLLELENQLSRNYEYLSDTD
nr:polymerase [Chuviridae sp.]